MSGPVGPLGRLGARLRAGSLLAWLAVGLAFVVQRPVLRKHLREDDFVHLYEYANLGLGRALLGSVADKVIRGARGPVLAVRPHDPS